MKLSIGFSPCPNDTFIFNALVNGDVPLGEIVFDRVILEDVETLNQWAMDGKLDVTKLSYHALGHVLDDYALLASGGALGRGCGPLVVSAEPIDPVSLPGMRIAIPGKYTTAHMLLRLFSPESRNIIPMRFDEIMPAIVSGSVDAGVIIHESRFTYHEYGLHLVQDLGDWWEKETGHPIPLGGIAAKKSLGKSVLGRINSCIRKSVEHAFQAPDSGLQYIKKHSREMNEEVIRSHINLYVNSFSSNLGWEGVMAVMDFLDQGRETGFLPAEGKLEIIGYFG